ncbi:MAG TPA: hypothetical protein VM871_12555 [Flavisolibacter sp.]|nr:hypothetical protein [Flavisolibacter sp.]
MLSYTTAQTHHDLEGILFLQRANLASNLPAEEMASQGFVTVVHTLADLRKLNQTERHIIAKDGEKVIAYLLAMTAAAKEDIPVLKPMFELFDKITLHALPVSTYPYIVVGQVCVDKAFRGQGVLDNCYHCYREAFKPKYKFAITEIATRNTRSTQAHRRIGFTECNRYVAPNAEEWSIVVWEW